MKPTPVDQTGAGGTTLASILSGTILSIVLTLFAFGVVASDAFTRWAAMVLISGAAIVQMVVHLHYFLHLNRRSAARWNVMASLLTLLIMTLFVGGTIWIMVHLKARMM